MAWITTVSEEEASGLLAETYERLRGSGPFGGFIPNIVKVFSLRPELLELVARVARTATFGGSSLSRVQEEMIASTVSAINRCHY